MEYVTGNYLSKDPIATPANYISKDLNIYDSFINTLKKLKEFIYSNVNRVVNQNEQDSEQIVLEIKDSFESIENILDKLPFYDDEYYYFSSIKDMAFYILEDKSLHSHLTIISPLINLFYDLIQIKKSDLKEYPDKQKEFTLLLSKHEQKFYTEICKPSEHYNEETLGKITNSLLNIWELLK